MGNSAHHWLWTRRHVEAAGAGPPWCRRGKQDRPGPRGSVQYLLVLAMVCLVVMGAAVGLGRTLSARMEGVNAAWSPGTRESTSHHGTAQPGTVSIAGLAGYMGTPEAKSTVLVLLLVMSSLCAGTYLLGRHSPRRIARAESPGACEVSSPQILETETRLFAKRQQLLRMLSSNIELLAANEILVRHLMTPSPLAVPADTKVNAILPLMREKRLHHVLVCGKEGELLGVISDRDIRGRCGVIARQIMTPRPMSVLPDTPLATAITQLVATQISCLPVVSQGRVCGILTTTDLVLVAHAFLQLWLRLPQDSPCGSATPLPLGS